MSDRDLAEAILTEIASDESVEQASFWWKALVKDDIGGSEATRWKILLHAAAETAIETVLARRQREAARTGPWQGSTLTFDERRRLFVLSGIPRRTPAEEAEYASLKARAEAEPPTEAPP